MELTRLHQKQDLELRIGIARAVLAEPFIFVSGTLSADEGGAVVGPGCMETQLRRVYQQLGEILERCGSGPDKVASETIYVTDFDAFMAHASVRRGFYGSHEVPSATGVQVSRLALPEALVEVSLVAHT